MAALLVPCHMGSHSRRVSLHENTSHHSFHLLYKQVAGLHFSFTGSFYWIAAPQYDQILRLRQPWLQSRDNRDYNLFAVQALLPIYEAYCVADVGDGTSAKLRDAIGLRLKKAENEPVVIDTDTD